MGTKGRSKQRKSGRPDPNKVLQGKAQPDILELLSLISAINPTDRDLPQWEAKSRYRTKSQLQSLLIGRFSEELEVLAEAGGEDFVLLRHRSSGQGSHARVSKLDEEARAWVRRRLDEGLVDVPPLEEEAESPRPAPVRRPERPGEGNMVAQGLLALEEHDYEGAKELLTMAMERSRGATEAVLPLLELLLDHLAAYGEAWALADGLPAATMTDPRVRALLGLAAAHHGDGDGAERLMRGLSGPRVEEALRALAGMALRENRIDEAQRHVTAARQRGGASLELVRLEEEVASRRSASFRADEEALWAAYEQGHLAEAEGMARDLLALWPQSDIARRVVNRMERQRREEELREALISAQRAMEGGDLAVAARSLRQAQALGADRITLEPLQARWKALDTAEREGAAVERVVGLLGKGDSVEAYLAYLALERPLRGRVREARGDEALLWLKEMRAPSGGSRARAAAEAVLALREAVMLLEDNPEAAHERMAPHGRVIKETARGRELWGRAEEGAARARQARAEGIFAQLEGIPVSDDLDKAQSIFDRLDPRGLGEEMRRKIKLMGMAIRLAQDLRRLHALVDARLDKHDFLGARQALDELIALGVPIGDADSSREQITELIRKAWMIRVIEGEDLPLSPCIDPEIDLIGPLRLRKDGRSLYLSTCHTNRLFIWELEVASGRTIRAVILRLPVNAKIVNLNVDEPSLWITGVSPCLALQLDLDTWDIRRWVQLGDQLGVRAVGSIDIMRGGNQAWIVFKKEDETGPYEALVLDLDKLQVIRDMPPFLDGPISVPQAQGNLNLMMFDSEHLSVFDFRGTPRLKVDFRSSYNTMGRVTLGREEGSFLMIGTTREIRTNTLKLAFRSISAEGAVTEPFLLDRDMVKVLGLFAAFQSGMIFTVLRRIGRSLTLMALRFAGEGRIEEVYRLEAPRGTSLIVDIDHQRVVAVASGDKGLQVLPLSEKAPPLVAKFQSGYDVGQICAVPETSSFESCEAFGQDSEELREREFAFSYLPPEKRQAYLEELREEARGDGAKLMDLYLLLSSEKYGGMREEHLAWAREHYPDLAVLRLLDGEDLVLRQEWEGALAILEGMSLGGLNSFQLRHRHHLLGLAYWARGEDDRAYRAWQEGQRFAGHCLLEPLAGLVAPLSAEAEPEEWGSDKPLTLQMRGAIRWADRCLEGGDGAGAISALERFFCRGVRDVQLLGRLTEAWLRTEAATEVERFQKTLVLAKFRDCLASIDSRRSYELPLREEGWSRERLTEVAKRAYAWMEESPVAPGGTIGGVPVP